MSERTFPPFNNDLFASVAESYPRVVALTAQTVLMTEDWRMKHGLSCFSSQAELDREPLNALEREIVQIPEEAPQERVLALLQAYAVVCNFRSAA